MSFCNCLELTQNIAERCEALGTYKKLTVKMFSNEDVVLFKAITDRDRDTSDIAEVIKSSKIDWEVILKECALQSGDRHWYGALLNKFHDLKENYGIDAPIASRLQELNDLRTLWDKYKELEKEGETRDAIFKILKNKYGATERDLKQLKHNLA